MRHTRTDTRHTYKQTLMKVATQTTRQTQTSTPIHMKLGIAQTRIFTDQPIPPHPPTYTYPRTPSYTQTTNALSNIFPDIPHTHAANAPIPRHIWTYEETRQYPLPLTRTPEWQPHQDTHAHTTTPPDTYTDAYTQTEKVVIYKDHMPIWYGHMRTTHTRSDPSHIQLHRADRTLTVRPYIPTRPLYGHTPAALARAGVRTYTLDT